MEEAFEQMPEIARRLVEPRDEPISSEQRREACLELCAETFDRLERQWQRGRIL